MNGNQGLEALAALCGGEAAVATDNNSNNNQGGNPHQSEGGGSAPAPATNNQSQSNNVQHGMQQHHHQQQLTEAITRQQWQQAVVAAAGALGATNNPGPVNGLTAQSLALLQAAGLQPASLQPAAAPQLQPKPAIDSNAAFAAMQQIAYLRLIQDAAAAKMGQNPVGNVNVNMNPLLHPNPQAVALALAGQAQQLQQQLSGTDMGGRQQVLPPAAAPSASAPSSQPDSSAASMSMPPPPSSGQGGATLPSTLSTAGIGLGAASNNSSGIAAAPATHRHAAIAPLPSNHVKSPEVGSVPIPLTEGMATAGVVMEDKKHQKRAANRRSAQLSRKRKKQFIEELKDENDELRRKEQILRSIPDLIVVFDSTGKLWFVSQSVSRFMNMTAKELEGTSFWDRLCEDSVRLLKAAFMDSLAARTDDSDTAPLGSGIWELRLVDKDGSHKVVTLNGVVHFSGDRPECVCSIRPRDELSTMPASKKQKQRCGIEGADTMSEKKAPAAASVSVSTGNGSDGTTTTASSTNDLSGSNSLHFQPLIRAKPHQSVISNSSSGRINNNIKVAAVAVGGDGKRREAARISDGDSGSTDESGSSDEIEETAD